MVSAALEGTLKQELKRVGTIDLRGPIQQAKDALLGELAKPLEGLVLELGEPSLRLGQIVVAADDLTVEVQFESDANVVFKALGN